MKHVFIDLDGTTLVNHEEIPSEVVEFVKQTHNKQFIFYVATGRPLSSCTQFHEELCLDTPIIADNGATVKYPNNEIDSVRLDKTQFVKILKNNQDLTDGIFLDNDDKTYITNEHPLFNQLTNECSAQMIKIDLNDGLPFAPKGAICVSKPDLVDELVKNINSYKGFKARKWSEKRFPIIEIYNEKISKAVGIKKIIDKYNIDIADTIAFGDDVNDEEMFKFVNTSIAVNNAVPSIKEVATIVSDYSNEQSSIARTLPVLFSMKKITN